MKWPWSKKASEPLVQIEPDPEMAEGDWVWSCMGCDAGGIGPGQEIRADAMRHSLATGHATRGDVVEA